MQSNSKKNIFLINRDSIFHLPSEPEAIHIKNYCIKILNNQKNKFFLKFLFIFGYFEKIKIMSKKV